MIRYENHCCNCATEGYPCRGKHCENRRVEAHYCDKCNCPIDRDLGGIYVVGGLELCEECLKDMFRERG